MADSTASIGPKDNLAAIFEAARVGNLDQDRLNAYRKNHPEFDIDGRGGDGMTLLAIACHEGHDRLVRSLVSPLNNANPNALSDHGRSPAHYTAISESRKEKQQTILEVLIAKGANLNVSCADGCTPLMKLIIAPEASPQLISLLVDSGADVGLKNNRNQTATWLAKSTNRSEIMTALRPRDERDGTKRTIFSRLLDVLHYIFFCINAAVGWVKNVFGISGCDDEELKRFARREADAQRFKTGLENFLAETGLAHCFAPGDDFLSTVIDKAAKLKEDDTTSLKTDQNIMDLTKVALFQPVIFCDNSGSMNTDGRFAAQTQLVKRIAQVATRLVPDEDGVHVEFLNGTLSGARLREDGVRDLMATHRVPKGTTKLGQKLKTKVLQPMVYDRLDARELKRPLLISIITDGAPEGPGECLTTFRDALVECKRRLVAAGLDPRLVRFQISQIGNDRHAKDFLKGLINDPELKGLLYCTTDRLDERFKELHDNEADLELWLLETLTGPIVNTA